MSKCQYANDASTLFVEAALYIYMCLCSDVVDHVCILLRNFEYLNSLNCLDVVHSLRGEYQRGICELCTNDGKIICSLCVYTFDTA